MGDMDGPTTAGDAALRTNAINNEYLSSLTKNALISFNCRLLSSRAGRWGRGVGARRRQRGPNVLLLIDTSLHRHRDLLCRLRPLMFTVTPRSRRGVASLAGYATVSPCLSSSPIL